MALNDLLWNGVKQQINFLQNMTKVFLNPPRVNVVGQIFSLLNVLGAINRKKIVSQQNKSFKPVAVPISPNAPPIESVNGIGKKLGEKLRSYGIATTEDLKMLDGATMKIPGISPVRLQKWQTSL